MSVEASFLMPWVIFLFIFLIYSGFYLYDKCVLFQDAYSLCFRGSVQKEKDEALEYVNGHMSERFGKKYFGTGGVEGEVKLDGNEVTVIGSCRVKNPIVNFFTISGENGWNIQTQAKARITNPVKIIRKCRMAENFMNKVGDENG